MPRHRRGVPLGVDQYNLDVKDDRRRRRGCLWHERGERGDGQQAEHEPIVPSPPPDVNASRSRATTLSAVSSCRHYRWRQ